MLKLHLPGSQPLCPTATGTQGTQPLAPLLHSLLLFCIPASHHFQAPLALMFSKSFLVPLFMFLLLSYPL